MTGRHQEPSSSGHMYTATDLLAQRLMEKMEHFIESTERRHAANEKRIDSIESELKQFGLVQTRWGAFGAGVCAVILAVWTLLKFFTGRS